MQDVRRQGDAAHRAREEGVLVLQRLALLFVPDGGGREAGGDECRRGRVQEADTD